MTINGGPLFVPDSDKSDFIKVRGVLFAVRRRLDLFAIGFFAVLVMCLAGFAQLTPTYTASTLLLLNTQNTQIVDFDMVLSGLATNSRLPIVDTEAGILTTNTLARTVVSRLRLMDDPEFNETLKEPGRLGRWISALSGAVGSVTGNRGDVEPLDDDDAEEAMMDRVTRAVGARVFAERYPSTFLIEIKFVSESAETAALVANTFAEVYIESQLEDKFNATQRANDWLSARLGSLGAELEASERQVEAYREEANLFAVDNTSLIETEIADLSTQLSSARAELAEAEARLGAVRSRLALGDGLDTLGEVLNSAVVNSLRRQQSEIIRRRAELESDLGPRHPTMVAINRELRDLEQQIDEEMQRIVRSLSSEVTIARERVTSLELSLADVQATFGDSSRAMIRLRELERAAEANRVLYDSFLTRFEQTNAQESLQQADAQVISPASVPRHQSFPNNAMFNTLAILLALGAGAAVVALAELFDSGFRTGEELEKATGLSVIGQVPLLSKADATVDGKTLQPIDYVIARPFSVFAECYRTIKAALIRPRAEGGGLMVVFTSGAPGEGKTVNTAAFARTLALSGTKVVVVDGDLRRRQLSGNLRPSAAGRAHRSAVRRAQP